MATISTEETTFHARIVEGVSAWPGIESGVHRFGATEFTVDGREIGHVHEGRVLDVNFPKRVKDALIAEGSTNEHRFAGGGWTSFYLDSEADLERSIRLLRISYLYTVLTMRRKPAGREILAELDLDAELESLGLSGELRAAFDRIRP